MKKILLVLISFMTLLTIFGTNKAEATHHYIFTEYNEYLDVKNVKFDYYIDDASILLDDSFIAAEIITVIDNGAFKSRSKTFFYNLADGRGWCYNNERSDEGGQPVTYKDYSGHAMDFILKYYNG